jgi:hypothetical protein
MRIVGMGIGGARPGEELPRPRPRFYGAGDGTAAPLSAARRALIIISVVAILCFSIGSFG